MTTLMMMMYDLKELAKLRMQEDVTKLYQLIEESSDVVDVLKSNNLSGCSIM